MKQTEYFVKNSSGEYEPVHFLTDANIVNVNDAGNYYNSSNAENVLQEVGMSLAAKANQVLITQPGAFAAALKTDVSQSYYIRGYNTENNVLFGANYSNGQLQFSYNGGLEWSASKGKPADVAIDNIKKIVIFKGTLYALCVTTADSLPKVFSAPYIKGDASLTWSAPLKTGVTGSNGLLYTNLTCDDQYVYFGEYGDPVGGPNLYRTADGTNWTTVYSDASARHCHAVSADPYNLGHVWLCIGDGVAKSILRSTNYGNTWTNYGNTQWQGVEISFSKDYIFIAADNIKGSVIIVDRSTLTPKWGSYNYHANIAVPGGAAGDRFYLNAFYGAVDPNTGIYYCIANDPSASSGTRYGLFYLPYVGGRLELIDPLISPLGTNGEVIIAAGYVWFGRNKYQLLTTA
jgi:hypothetical protein